LDALDYAVVDILDTKYPLSLGYNELVKEISIYCNVPHYTLSRHLKRLVGKEILYRKENRKYGPTFYSLTTKFKESLDIQRKHYPTNYLENTFSLYPYSRWRYEVAFDFRKGWSDIGKKYSPTRKLY
jgi:DNA-binding HxlR family transcriptional regulator